MNVHQHHKQQSHKQQSFWSSSRTIYHKPTSSYVNKNDDDRDWSDSSNTNSNNSVNNNNNNTSIGQLPPTLGMARNVHGELFLFDTQNIRTPYPNSHLYKQTPNQVTKESAVSMTEHTSNSDNNNANRDNHDNNAGRKQSTSLGPIARALAVRKGPFTIMV